MLINTEKSAYARLSPIPVRDIDWDEGFWKERFDTCADVTVPHIRAMFENPSPIFHVVENFRVAAGLHSGTHEGTPLEMEIFINGWRPQCMLWPNARIKSWRRIWTNI